MNSCASCGKVIIKGGICSACWKEWTFTGTYTVQSIDWLNELVRIQRRYEGNSHPRREFSFSETGMDEDSLYDREVAPMEEEMNYG